MRAANAPFFAFRAPRVSRKYRAGFFQWAAATDFAPCFALPQAAWRGISRKTSNRRQGGKIAGGPECARAFAADTRAERYSETARLWAEVRKSNIATSIGIRICPWRAKGGICFRARESLFFRDRAGRNPESQKRRNAFCAPPSFIEKTCFRVRRSWPIARLCGFFLRIQKIFRPFGRARGLRKISSLCALKRSRR